MNSTDSNNVQSQEDLARQWIDFLRKRNNLLSILWPLFLVLAVVAVIAAFYFQQSARTAEVEKTLLVKEKEEMISRLGIKDIEIKTLEEKNSDLANTVATLNERLEEGDQEVKDGNEKAVFDAQLISNLESQVELLKTENSALTEALEENKALVELHKGSLAKKQGLKDDLLKENAELLSKLESRKIAYSALTKRLKEMQAEVDRLVSVNISQERQLEKNKNSMSSYNKKLVENTKLVSTLNSEISKLETENERLNGQLQSMLAPVGTANKASSKTTTVEQGAALSKQTVASSESTPSASVNSLVFEEIKAVKPVAKPVVKPVVNKTEAKPKDSSFDYDKIEVP